MLRLKISEAIVEVFMVLVLEKNFSFSSHISIFIFHLNMAHCSCHFFIPSHSPTQLLMGRKVVKKFFSSFFSVANLCSKKRKKVILLSLHAEMPLVSTLTIKSIYVQV